MKANRSKMASVQTKTTGPFFRKEKGPDVSCAEANNAFFSKNPVRHSGIQPKLNIGQPNDHYEKEADSVADGVVQRLSNVHEKFAPAHHESVQRRALPITPLVQRLLQRKCDACVPEQTKEIKQEAPAADKKVQRKPIFDSNAEPPEDNANIQRKCSSCEAEEKKEKEGDTKEKKLQRKPIFESDGEKEESSVQRKCSECEKEEKISRKESGAQAEKDTSSIESKLNGSKGSGNPLPETTKEHMESSIGADFSNVRIHNDSQAAQMSHELNAQAFTHGNDIYFNSGKYDTSSSAGQHLLAHELTHTVQQSDDSSIHQIVQKKGGSSTNAKPDFKKATKDELESAKDSSGSIEKIKGGQLVFHIAELKTKKYSIDDTVITEVLKGRKKDQPIPKGERDTKQDSIWKSQVRAESKAKMKNVAGIPEERPIEPDLMRLQQKKAKKAYKGIVGTFTQLANEVLVPMWDIKGESSNFQIEHMIDWQLIDTPYCDKIQNLILLESEKNREVGDKVKKAIPEALAKISKNYAKEFTGVPLDGREVKSKYDVVIDKISGEGPKLNDKLKYDAKNFTDKTDTNNPFKPEFISIKEDKIPDGYFLLSSSDNRASYLIPFKAKGLKIGAFKVTVEQKAGKVESLTLESLINAKTTEVGVQQNLKKVDVTVKDEKEAKYIVQADAEKGAISPVLKSLALTKFSPIIIEEKDIVINGFDVSAKGHVASTLSILKGVDISFIYENGDFDVKAVIPIESIGKNIPKPFKVDYCNIEIGGGTSTPIYIAGGLGFSIEKFGEGEIFAKLDKNGVSFEGTFNFEAKWFDPAVVCISYEKGEWSISGKIGLKKGLLKGVKSATFCIGYVNRTFSASGDAELEVPGLDKIKLGASIAENGDLTFFAEVQLKKMTGIKSGMVRVTITSKGNGELGVKVAGEAEPDFPSIPELAAKLTVLYEDGVFDMRATAKYKKGRFDGSIEVGVTNRQVDETGKLTGEADPKNALSVFGYGTLTVDLFKNIKGTVGIRLTPAKDVLVAGEILTQNISPFGDGYSFDKEIVSFPSISIPLIGIPGMSVSAFIEGGVHFKFNWQPLILKELRVGFKETNINELEKINLDIKGTVGSAAHAEVYLEIKAGIEAQVLIAELRGALAGQAGLGLDAEAGGEVNAGWNMDKGLQFKEIRAFLNVTPRAIFRLVGSVDVNLDLWITKVNLYHHDWVLAEKQIDLGGVTLKLDFPIKFNEEGKVQLPEYEKMNVEKPDFSGDSGKKILNEAINGDAEKELEEKKRNIRQKIRYDLRNSTNDEDFTPSSYREEMMEKYEDAPELQQFVSVSIEEESRILEYEHFENEKALIRKAVMPLQTKLNMINIFMMFHRYITPTDIAIFRMELIVEEELKKIREAEAAAAAKVPPPPPPEETPADKQRDPAKAPKPLNKQKSVQKKEMGAEVNGSAPKDEKKQGENLQRCEDVSATKNSDIEEKKDAPTIQKKDMGLAVPAPVFNKSVLPQKTGAGVIVQRVPVEELDASFKKSLEEKNYAKAAEHLNGFSLTDLLERLRDKPTGIVAAIHAGALSNPLVGAGSQAAKETRWAFLEMNFKNEVKRQQWKQAATYMNGFNESDVKKYLTPLEVAVKASLRTAAIPEGFAVIVKIVDADIDFQTFEKARIAKLEDDYNTAIAKKDWPNAAGLLNAYNDDDIQLKLALLQITSPESVKLIRAAADQKEENSRVGKFAQAIVLGSKEYLKQLLAAGPLIKDVWTMQFLKGMEMSGVTARFGQGWEKVKDNFSDPAKAAQFIGGIYMGFYIGVVKDVWENIKGIIVLAWDLVKLQIEAMFEPVKLGEEIIRIVKALPDLILKLMNGEEIGYQTGLYLSKNIKNEFIDQSPVDQGKFVGEIVGRISTEIALLFVGIEEVNAVAKAMRATKWGVAVADAVEASKVGKALLEAKNAGKLLKGAEEIAIDAEKVENALSKMARIEEKAPNITEDMMKLEQKVMADRASKSADFVKPIKEAGFDAEIKVGDHTYKRMEVEGTWCRFSKPVCDVKLPAEVEAKVDEKVPAAVRLAYAGEKKAAKISGDTFERARAFRQTLGMEEEAMKKNVAIAKVVTEEKQVIFLEAANQGAGGAHSEEMIAGQLTDLNNKLKSVGKKGRVVELFSERVPCGNCREVIRSFFGEIDVFYMAGSAEPNRWKLIRDRWMSIEKALAATKK